MIDIASLKAEMVRNGLTQKDMANKLNMSPRTFSNKLKKGVFGSDEIDKMISELKIKNPIEIFFATRVS